MTFKLIALFFLVVVPYTWLIVATIHGWREEAAERRSQLETDREEWAQYDAWKAANPESFDVRGRPICPRPGSLSRY